MKIITNLITTSRLIFTIVLMFLYQKIPNYIFLGLIAIIFSTDFIDGKLARAYHVETFYGSIMDTISDKVLNIALIMPLIKLSKLFYLLLISELIILLINVIGTLRGKKTRSLLLGRIKMWFVFFTIIFGYANIFNYLKKETVIITLIITLVLELIVIIDYLIFLLKQKKNPNRFKVKNIKDAIYFFFDTDYYKEHK